MRFLWYLSAPILILAVFLGCAGATDVLPVPQPAAVVEKTEPKPPGPLEILAARQDSLDKVAREIEADTLWISAFTGNVRDQGSLRSKVVDQLPQGAMVFPRVVEGDWFNVLYGKSISRSGGLRRALFSEGWVHKSIVSHARVDRLSESERSTKRATSQKSAAAASSGTLQHRILTREDISYAACRRISFRIMVDRSASEKDIIALQQDFISRNKATWQDITVWVYRDTGEDWQWRLADYTKEYSRCR
jgi:hypothetical protein